MERRQCRDGSSLLMRVHDLVLLQRSDATAIFMIRCFGSSSPAISAAESEKSIRYKLAKSAGYCYDSAEACSSIMFICHSQYYRKLKNN